MALALAMVHDVVPETGRAARCGKDPIKTVRKYQAAAAKFALSKQPITMRELRAELGVGIDAVVQFIRICRHIPWIAVTQVDDQYIFEIDSNLKDICDLRKSQTSLGGRSVGRFLGDLRKEISRRRKENNAQRLQRKWNTESILKLELIELLDWIESELDKVTTG